MSPSRPFIDRPVATALLMLAIVLAGLLGLRWLPLSALPELDYPTIEVQTLYPGASPEVMGRTVTAPLERQLGQMAGLARGAGAGCGRAEGAGGHQGGQRFAARRPAGAAGVRQGQPRRRPGADA